VLALGRAGEIRPEEPVAWTFNTAAGGRVFYTTLGHRADFESPQFMKLLGNGIWWAVGGEPLEEGVALSAPEKRPPTQSGGGE
jgi:type 1 glutamine amidotransferase